MDINTSQSNADNLNKVRRDARGHFSTKLNNWKLKFKELETNNEIKCIIY